MQKYYRIVLIFLILFTGLKAQDDDQSGYHVKTVVIDAGHGGKDPGCHGAIANEKDVCLKIALKLGAYIKENFPKTKVIYTRETDVFLELHERSTIANKNDADLFISIHANAASPAAFGTETYVMGLKYQEKNKDYISHENQVIYLEKDYEKNYELNLESPKAKIMLSMIQAEYLNNSIILADKIEKQFKDRVGRHSRGVRQKVLYVMYNTYCPSVLIETGFLTNKNEEKFLNSEQGQTYLSSAVYRAFRDYKLESEGYSKSEIDSLIKLQKEKGIALPDGPRKTAEVKEKAETENEKTPEPKKPVKPKPTNMTASQAKKKAENAKKQSKEKSKKENKKELNVFYSVQIISSSESVKLDNPSLEKASDVFEYQQGGWYKYASGKFVTFEEAFKQKQSLKTAGFEGVFVIAFEGEKRISIQEAKEKLK